MLSALIGNFCFQQLRSPFLALTLPLYIRKTKIRHEAGFYILYICINNGERYIHSRMYHHHKTLILHIQEVFPDNKKV